VLKGGPTLFGLMLAAIGLGSILGAFLLSFIPSYYPRHHPIPLAMFLFAVVGLLFSFCVKPGLSLLALVFCGIFWLLTLNPSNTAKSTPGHGCEWWASFFHHVACSTRRDASRASLRRLYDPFPVSTMGAAHHAGRSPDRRGCLRFRPRARH